MKYLFFVSLACLTLTGCFGPKANNNDFGYNNNLRAPAKGAYKSVPQETAPVVMPQSVTQPAPAQQPFVQTIVIPQYAPQPMYGAGGMPVVQNMPYAAVPTPTTVSAPAMPTVAQNQENVYPSWASSSYTPPAQANQSNNIVLLQSANRTETVQCAVFDSMCINSYRQQGYHQISGQKFPGNIDEAGYPQTVQKAESNIPRW